MANTPDYSWPPMESRKIMGLPNLAVSATCVRVPIFFCHSEAAHLTFRKPLTPDQAREILRKAPGVKVIDDLKEHIYPMPILGAGDDDTLVGRIRTDLSEQLIFARHLPKVGVRPGWRQSVNGALPPS